MCLVILSYKFDPGILNQFYSDKMQKFFTLVYFLVIFFFIREIYCKWVSVNWFVLHVHVVWKI